MANTYPAFAFPLKPGVLSERLESVKQVVDLLNDETIQNEILAICEKAKQGGDIIVYAQFDGG